MTTPGKLEEEAAPEESDRGNSPTGSECGDDLDENPITSSIDGKSKKKRDGSTLRKAPQAPKRFKSSYIMFFMAKQQEIKDELGAGATVAEVSKRSSEMWKNLPAEERAHWDDAATKDKQRYMAEKATYTGPWQVPWKRAKKDPSAPKRPMSAFLFFSQDRRRILKEQNPGMRNTEISRILGDLWRKATDEERNPHIEREAREREKYKVSIAKWRLEDEARKEAQKKAQEEQAKYTAAYPPQYTASPEVDVHHQPSPYYPPQGAHSQSGGYSDPGYYLQGGYRGQPPAAPPSGPYRGYYSPYPPPPPQNYHQSGYDYPMYPSHSGHYPPSSGNPAALGPSGIPQSSQYNPSYGGYYQQPGPVYGDESPYSYHGEHDPYSVQD